MGRLSMVKQSTLAVLVVGMLIANVSAQTGSQVWCGVTKHPGDIPLLRSAQPSFETGNTLYAVCTSGNQARCAGYIVGVADVFQSQNTTPVCLPTGVTGLQLVDVVKKYLADNPAERHYAAPSEIQLALGN